MWQLVPTEAAAAHPGCPPWHRDTDTDKGLQHPPGLTAVWGWVAAPLVPPSGTMWPNLPQPKGKQILAQFRAPHYSWAQLGAASRHLALLVTHRLGLPEPSWGLAGLDVALGCLWDGFGTALAWLRVAFGMVLAQLWLPLALLTVPGHGPGMVPGREGVAKRLGRG